MQRYLISLVVEIIGVSVVSAGIGVEIATGAEVGHILITLGSLTIASGALIWAKIIRRR